MNKEQFENYFLTRSQIIYMLNNKVVFRHPITNKLYHFVKVYNKGYREIYFLTKNNDLVIYQDINDNDVLKLAIDSLTI